MTMSTPHQSETLVSALRKAFEESDKPPADVTTFAEAVFSWRTIDADLVWVFYDLPNEEMTPDE